MDFEWDLSKEILNLRKHGIQFSEAVESFFDPQGFQMVDRKHSGNEQRLYWIGKSASGRILTTWFTKRGRLIRIIGSAEWRKFRRLYETTQTE
ncbi:MAG TPA: BrnT family toxin [Bdellovibrionota bacterium]|nr:BrnT family toxin [Bdellovibrionota bacterium]